MKFLVYLPLCLLFINNYGSQSDFPIVFKMPGQFEFFYVPIPDKAITSHVDIEEMLKAAEDICAFYADQLEAPKPFIKNIVDFLIDNNCYTQQKIQRCYSIDRTLESRTLFYKDLRKFVKELNRTSLDMEPFLQEQKKLYENNPDLRFFFIYIYMLITTKNKIAPFERNNIGLIKNWWIFAFAMTVVQQTDKKFFDKINKFVIGCKKRQIDVILGHASKLACNAQEVSRLNKILNLCCFLADLYHGGDKLALEYLLLNTMKNKDLTIIKLFEPFLYEIDRKEIIIKTASVQAALFAMRKNKEVYESFGRQLVGGIRIVGEMFLRDLIECEEIFNRATCNKKADDLKQKITEMLKVNLFVSNLKKFTIEESKKLLDEYEKKINQDIKSHVKGLYKIQDACFHNYFDSMTHKFGEEKKQECYEAFLNQMKEEVVLQKKVKSESCLKDLISLYRIAQSEKQSLVNSPDWILANIRYFLSIKDRLEKRDQRVKAELLQQERNISDQRVLADQEEYNRLILDKTLADELRQYRLLNREGILRIELLNKEQSQRISLREQRFKEYLEQELGNFYRKKERMFLIALYLDRWIKIKGDEALAFRDILEEKAQGEKYLRPLKHQWAELGTQIKVYGPYEWDMPGRRYRWEPYSLSGSRFAIVKQQIWWDGREL